MLKFLRYIDDGLSIEKLCNNLATYHYSASKEVRIIHAEKTERFFNITNQNAKLIGMKINAAKTQMLCVNVAKNSVNNSYINIGEGLQITGGEELKMLGFVFGRHPNAGNHVKHIQKKYYAKCWTLRHLQKIGADEEMLTK